jgi:phosphopantetheinyl transferase (holo-ACP synthase)
VTPGTPLAHATLVRDDGATLLALRRQAGEPEVVLGLRERALLAEMPWPLRRAEWLSGRLAAKELLRLGFALEPSRVEVLPEESGAPSVWVDGGRSKLQLNLSHTRTWAVAAAADFTVGVDVADDNDGRRLPRIARRVMSGNEAEQCGAHTNERTQAAVWAIKEAGLKLRVGGVFSPGARSVHILSLEPPKVADPTMTLALFRLPDAAVALAREAPNSPRPMTREQLEQRYGAWYAQRARGLELERIAPDLWPLLPYAEVWAGEPSFAPAEAAEDLTRMLVCFRARLDEWLKSAPPSAERAAFESLHSSSKTRTPSAS